ncbi:MAG: dTDP-4-dehydrorhamnose reductase [Balneolaceae bacterium]
MRFLITGAKGQLGREWMKFLKDSDHEIFGFGSKELDITDVKNVQAIFKQVNPDLVINCAAYTKVDQAEEEPEIAFKVNEIGVMNLSAACGIFGAKLVHYSTDYVFSGNADDNKIYPNGYPEDVNPDPINVYGKSKRAGEEAIEKQNSDGLILRVSWLCGQYGNNFVKTMLRLGKEKSELNVVDDQFGSPTFCFDVVEKTMGLINQEKNGYFHISSEGSITWFQLAEKIFEMSDDSPRLNPVPSTAFASKAKRPAFSYLNTHKLKNTGLQSIFWETGLKKLIHQITEE